MDFSLKQGLGFLISLLVCAFLIFAFGSLLSTSGDQSSTHTIADDSFFKSEVNEQILSQAHPVITVEEIHLDVNQPSFTYDYLKTKAHAIDAVDGDISTAIQVKGVIDITKAGSYPIRFTVENSFGLKTSYIKCVLID